MGAEPESLDMGDTSIRVSEELADELYSRKGRATSYEDFLWSLLDRVDGHEQPQAREQATEQAPRDDEPVHDPQREQLRDELAGSGDLLDRRVDAILAMYGVLRERGEAEKDDLLNVVDVDATGYASADSVWSNMVKGCDTLRALPGVEPPSTGLTTWTYIGDS